MADFTRVPVPRDVIDDMNLDPGNECGCFLHFVLSDEYRKYIRVGTEVITIGDKKFGISTGLEDWQENAMNNEGEPNFTRDIIPEIVICINEQTRAIWIEGEETPVFYIPQE